MSKSQFSIKPGDIMRSISLIYVFSIALCTTISSPPARASTLNYHSRQIIHRNLNLIADASGRAFEAAIARQNYRGRAPIVTVEQPLLVYQRQITELGIPSVKSGARGVLVVANVSDRTGTWKDFYVYDEQTHLILYEAERSGVPVYKKRSDSHTSR